MWLAWNATPMTKFKPQVTSVLNTTNVKNVLKEIAWNTIILYQNVFVSVPSALKFVSKKMVWDSVLVVISLSAWAVDRTIRKSLSVPVHVCFASKRHVNAWNIYVLAV